MVVVLPRPWDSYSPDEHILLNKILTSVKVSIDGVNIVVQPRLDLGKLAYLSPGRVLAFCTEGEEGVTLYEETPAQGFTLIRADELDRLDDQKKKNLWMALRKMFGI